MTDTAGGTATPELHHSQAENNTMAPIGMDSVMSWGSSPEVAIISAVAFLVLSITLLALCTSCNSVMEEPMGAQNQEENKILKSRQHGNLTNCHQTPCKVLKHQPTSQTQFQLDSNVTSSQQENGICKTRTIISYSTSSFPYLTLYQTVRWMEMGWKTKLATTFSLIVTGIYLSR